MCQRVPQEPKLNIFFWACLWECLWMASAFELVDSVKQIALPRVRGIIQSFEGLNRRKGIGRKNMPSFLSALFELGLGAPDPGLGLTPLTTLILSPSNSDWIIPAFSGSSGNRYINMYLDIDIDTDTDIDISYWYCYSGEPNVTPGGK